MTARCPETNNSQQCALVAGHTGLHQLPTPTFVPGAAPTTRAYHGSLRSATEKFQRDAEVMAQQGWVPTTQSYAPGSWSGAAFLVALLLCVVLVGFLVFIYMLIVKPDGVLVVTYEHRPAPVATVVTPVAPTAATDMAVVLARLGELHDRGLITPEEYDTKRSEVLARI